MAQLQAQSLSLGYDKSTIVNDLSLELPTGEVTMIVGANGCGKSTLLRGLSRLLKPSAGSVVLDGKDIHTQPAREIAKVLGLLPQTPIAPDGITVRELVGRGRYPHQGWFRRWSSEDDDAVARAMHATGTEELADRAIDELSGGQRQRVWIAMALAQETDLLLLDEPTTYLDVAHQLEVLDVVADLNRRRGTTVAIVLHDLNLAARYADHLVALKGGEVYAQGHPAAVVTEKMVQDVFGMPSRVIPDPVAGTPLVLPIGRNRVVRGTNHDENASRAAAGGRSTGTLPRLNAPQDTSMSPVSAGSPAEAIDGEDGLKPSLEVCQALAFNLTTVAATTISPNYRRVTFSGPDLEHFGTGGHPLDLRIKLVIPGPEATKDHFARLRPDGRIAEGDVTGWYRHWLQKDPADRGWMRTYSIRSYRAPGHPGNAGQHAEIDIDFVLHVSREDGKLVGGPASVWAAEAEPGQQITMIGPNKHLVKPDYAGIEFKPGSARRILLAGDETAAPAICSILETLPPGMTGNAFIEVPSVDDIQGSFTRSGVSVQWLPRGSRPHGELLGTAVRGAVAIPAAGAVVAGQEPEDVNIDETILWEPAEAADAPFYAWLAGEAGTIKELRRYLVRDAGINRKQVSFMGYWRRGKAEM